MILYIITSVFMKTKIKQLSRDLTEVAGIDKLGLWEF